RGGRSRVEVRPGLPLERPAQGSGGAARPVRRHHRAPAWLRRAGRSARLLRAGDPSVPPAPGRPPRPPPPRLAPRAGPRQSRRDVGGGGLLLRGGGAGPSPQRADGAKAGRGRPAGGAAAGGRARGARSPGPGRCRAAVGRALRRVARVSPVPGLRRQFEDDRTALREPQVPDARHPATGARARPRDRETVIVYSLLERRVAAWVLRKDAAPRLFVSAAPRPQVLSTIARLRASLEPDAAGQLPAFDEQASATLFQWLLAEPLRSEPE